MTLGKPLRGRRVLITRPRRDAEPLADLLRSRGAEPILAPAIEILPPDDPKPLDAALRLAVNGGVEWTVFTSPRSVESVVARLVVLKFELRLPTLHAVVGEGTADALLMLGREPDLMPPEFTTAALGEAFPVGKGKVLLPRADIAPPGLEDVLREKGWDPVRVTAYRTTFAETLPADAAAALEAVDPDDGAASAIVFTSASTVHGFVHAGGHARAGLSVVAIGPVAGKAAEDAGFTVDAIAEPHTMEGIAKALARLFKGSR